MSIGQRLNPAAPMFMGNMSNIFRKDKDREKESSNKDKESIASTDKPRSKKEGKGKGKGKEVTTPSLELPPPNLEDSPSDSRISRDTYSEHTQPSMTESHDSLPLDSSMSNAASEPHHSGSYTNLRDQENVVKKLFRKGSSSKFSLSGRPGKDFSLFKKGPGSTTNSDKNMSAEHRSSIGDLDDLGEDTAPLGRSYDSVTSSPSLGPARTKDSKESRMSAWRFGMKKKGKETPSKEKESLDMDRAPEEE